jgi:hypothetical protein
MSNPELQHTIYVTMQGNASHAEAPPGSTKVSGGIAEFPPWNDMILCVFALFAHAVALPHNIGVDKVATVANGLNLISIKFMPNGFAVFVDRKGFIAIGDVYANAGANNINQHTYLDLTSETYSYQNQWNYAELGLWDVAFDPDLENNRKSLLLTAPSGIVVLFSP